MQKTASYPQNLQDSRYLLQNATESLDILTFTKPSLPSGKLSHNYGKSPFFMGKLTISMAMFNSYFDITRGYIPLNPIKPPFSYGFPMVFPWFWHHQRVNSEIFHWFSTGKCHRLRPSEALRHPIKAPVGLVEAPRLCRLMAKRLVPGWYRQRADEWMFISVFIPPKYGNNMGIE